MDTTQTPPQTISELLTEWGEPAYRARQVLQAKRHGAMDWEAVSSLSKPLRQRLAEAAPLWSFTPETEQTSTDGTIKWRLRASDGRPYEAVLIAHARGRRTLCVSSQVGCALGCGFCATGMLGPGRDLSAGEIVDQALLASAVAERDGARLANVVFMGMGEPLQNLDAVLAACGAMNDPETLGISARKIAISTAGWVPGIAELAEHPLPVRLAISLHAADDETRSRLMPINKRYPIATLLGACRRYCDTTGRRIFIEYLLLDGVNDSPEQAKKLASVIRDGRFHVNLIEYNPTAGPYRASSVDRRERFVAVLARAGIEASVRRSRGADIAAACGQLALTKSPRSAAPSS